MPLQRMPHDELFKRMMSDMRVARDFFAIHLPPLILQQVKLETLHIEPCSYIDEHLKSRHADMLYHVETHTDVSAYFYLLVEHQSTVDTLMSFRLHYTAMQILDRHIRNLEPHSPLPLPLVYPILFYNGGEPYSASRDIFTLFGEQEPLARLAFLQPFQLVDVSTLEDEAIRKHRWAGIMEWCAYHGIARDFIAHFLTLDKIIHDINAHPLDDLLTTVLHYIITSMEAENASTIVLEALDKVLPPVMEKNMVTLAEKIYSEGELKGELKGKLEGERTGKLKGIAQTLRAIELLRKGHSIKAIMMETGLEANVLAHLSHEIGIEV